MHRPALVALLLAAPAWAGARPPVADPDAPVPSDPIPVEPMDDGTGVVEVVAMRPFHLAQPMAYDHLAGQPPVADGLQLVVRVRPDLAQARAVRSPVLYVGPTPVLVVARDPASGCVAGLVPAGLDLAVEPVGFGSPELPERVDAHRGEAERAALLAAGVRPRPAVELTRATRADPLVLPHGDALRAATAEAISACR